MVGQVALFFALFAVPSCVLAVLALREFHLRGEGEGERRVKRAALLLVGATGVMEVLVLLTFLATDGAPLRTSGGWVFLGFGAVMGLLGPIGAALFRRASRVPMRRTIKAAETIPGIVLMLNLVLVANAAMQAP